MVSRRSVIAGIGCAAAVGTGVPLLLGEERIGVAAEAPIRPPGALPEDKFLPLCVRCGQCIKVCPNNVLQAASFEEGFNGLWAPRVTPDWSGCEPSCNNCGQVCPTGAIRALKLEEKRAARIGLAIVDEKHCLPFAGRDDCRLCVDECNAAGYEAIEFVRVGGEADEQGEPVEGTGYLAPVVLGDKCVGCGLCQMRCMGINVKEKKLLDRPAIRVAAGVGKEDRLTRGSYIELREARTEKKAGATSPDTEAGGEEYLPDFLK